MANSESGMVDKAAYVLHSLMGSSEGRTAAVEEGGIPVLVIEMAKLIRFPISSGGIADRDATAAAEPKPPREAVGGGRCGGVTSSPPQSGDPTPTLVVRMLSASFLRFFQPARACK
jgi:hypothetical protein